MTFDLRKVRKAVAGLVGSAITAGVSYLTVKIGWAPEATVGVSAALVAAVTGLIYKIPNEVNV
jgi:hypothetical protein